jgi:hypothetical protein
MLTKHPHQILLADLKLNTAHLLTLLHMDHTAHMHHPALVSPLQLVDKSTTSPTQQHQEAVLLEDLLLKESQETHTLTIKYQLEAVLPTLTQAMLLHMQVDQAGPNLLPHMVLISCFNKINLIKYMFIFKYYITIYCIFLNI